MSPSPPYLLSSCNQSNTRDTVLSWKLILVYIWSNLVTLAICMKSYLKYSYISPSYWCLALQMTNVFITVRTHLILLILIQLSFMKDKLFLDMIGLYKNKNARASATIYLGLNYAIHKTDWRHFKSYFGPGLFRTNNAVFQMLSFFVFFFCF